MARQREVKEIKEKEKVDLSLAEPSAQLLTPVSRLETAREEGSFFGCGPVQVLLRLLPAVVTPPQSPGLPGYSEVSLRLAH
jgi:hypothetical protein